MLRHHRCSLEANPQAHPRLTLIQGDFGEQEAETMEMPELSDHDRLPEW